MTIDWTKPLRWTNEGDKSRFTNPVLVSGPRACWQWVYLSYERLDGALMFGDKVRTFALSSRDWCIVENVPASKLDLYNEAYADFKQAESSRKLAADAEHNAGEKLRAARKAWEDEQADIARRARIAELVRKMRDGMIDAHAYSKFQWPSKGFTIDWASARDSSAGYTFSLKPETRKLGDINVNPYDTVEVRVNNVTKLATMQPIAYTLSVEQKAAKPL